VLGGDAHAPLAQLAIRAAVRRPGKARGPARRQLPEDTHRDVVGDLDREVHEVVRDRVVVARRRMHRQLAGAHRVPSLARARERHFHSDKLAAGPNRIRTRGCGPDEVD
jgi:hypothetical protein